MFAVLLVLSAFHLVVTRVSESDSAELFHDGFMLLQRHVKTLRAPTCQSLRAVGVKMPTMDSVLDHYKFEQEYLSADYALQIYGAGSPAAQTAFYRSSAPNKAGYGHSHSNGSFGDPRQRIVMHHIWKTGGTHLCELARETGAKVPKNNGCHRFINDATPVAFENYVGETMWRPCAIDETLAKIPFDIVGHECAITSEDIQQANDAGFKVVGVVRNPVEQAYSWLAHALQAGTMPLQAGSPSFSQWLNNCGCSVSAPKCGFFTFQPNLQTRFLAGGACDANPEADGCLDLALSNLEKMNVVLEQSGSKLLGTEKLARVGWIIEKDDEANEHISGALSLMSNASEADQALVRELQSIDIQLINKARAKGLI